MNSINTFKGAGLNQKMHHVKLRVSSRLKPNLFKSSRRLTLPMLVLTLLVLMMHPAKCSDVSHFRSKLSLDGAWNTVTTPDSVKTPPTSGWQPTIVPGTIWISPEGGSHYIWFRRRITIPSAWSGMRVFVEVRGARYDPHLYIDGKLIGSQFNGWSPMETEITSAVSPGSEHTLVLRCQDQGANFVKGFVLTPGMSDAAQRGSVIAPVGGYRNNCGIWEPIYLEAFPMNRIPNESLQIITSTRKRELTLKGSTDGTMKGLWVSAQVLDGDATVLNMSPVPVQSDGKWTLTDSFPNAHYWSPEDPFLYTLHVQLRNSANGNVLDELSTPFGFKEIWTQGPNFYLNGAPIHFLASSTWPDGGYDSFSVIKKRMEALKAGGVNAFRLHNSIWEEEWLKAADEVGVLIVDEAAVYSDGSGYYAYNNPEFWKNYRNHIKGMIDRDRNHACLAMWSLGNEILFMGNQKYDANLPRQLGDLGRYAKTLDPYHPITFEGDQDPDGAYDVIGLHYPHELPWYDDYPNTCNWLGSRIVTNASGGMLGSRSTGFFWDRKKPLYIGEFLWVPQNDYSVGSIFFGDDSYLNRSEYHMKAQAQAFYDQTIAYRCSGVSGISPWSVFGFGAVNDNPLLYAMEKRFYRPVTAYLRNRGLRFYSGEKTTLVFDILNDSYHDANLTLKLLDHRNGTALATKSLRLNPGGYQSVTLPFTAERVASERAEVLTSVLYADGKKLYEVNHTIRIFPRINPFAAKGCHVVFYDPSGKLPGAHRNIAFLDSIKNRRNTILVIAPYALSSVTNPSPHLPVVGNRNFDTTRFVNYLKSGGRVVVLEQKTLAPLGLGLNLTDHRSTMTFPLDPENPIVKGLEPDDLKFWRSDNYVTTRQIARPTKGGARAVIVSGGADSIDLAPIVEMRVGKGDVILIQALAGEKWDVDPAAGIIIHNAIHYLASMAAPKGGGTVALCQDPDCIKFLQTLGVECVAFHHPLTEKELHGVRWLILQGGGEDIQHSRQAIASFIKHGGSVYWHNPDASTLATYDSVLDLKGIRAISVDCAGSLYARDNPLLSGVSREDLNCATAPQGWQRQIRFVPHTVRYLFTPDSAAFEDKGAIAPQRSISDGKARAAAFSVPGDGVGNTITIMEKRAGFYPLTISASYTGTRGGYPILRVDVNRVETLWIPVQSSRMTSYPSIIHLPAGASVISVQNIDMMTGMGLRLAQVSVGTQLHYPAGRLPLITPSSLVTWKIGRSRIVLDGNRWNTTETSSVKGERFANALLANLGLEFTMPSGVTYQSIPLNSFRLIGSSPYYDATDSLITLRSNGKIQSKFYCARGGEYEVAVEGYSTPMQNVFAKIRIWVDDKLVGDREIASNVSAKFDIGKVFVSKGTHTVSIEYYNDASGGGEDRNLFLGGVLILGK